ncbi:hypothetical protein HHK36_027082 [Tetracentron sinense]|uniref:GED domain-containing protein n=1 Tax=Tetracentron sinense TaxID=13715 RepID=A0A835D2Q2_TETSI|nr:hypothetical protein HHK36_027082 [Tetracentron sinense]
MVDSLALHLLFSVQKLVNKEMEKEIVNELLGPHGTDGIKRMLEESPAVASKRERLNQSIRLLRDSQHVVANIIDRITVYSETSYLFTNSLRSAQASLAITEALPTLRFVDPSLPSLPPNGTPTLRLIHRVML